MRDVETLKPFTRFLMTIGTLPSSYLISMTYEEQLLWFCNFLKNEVIPTVNNNAEAVIELQNYVSSYFDNLDVQEEINNKLDEMAESGQLTDIIAQYLQLAGVLAFDTVSDMKSGSNLVNGSICRTLGYNLINDGGNGVYKIRTVTNEDTIDEGSIIALDDVTLVAELIIDEVNVKQFGASGNGTTDDTEAINNAITYCKANNKKLTSPSGNTYLISEPLAIDNLTLDFNYSTIITNSAIDIITIDSETYYGEISNLNIDMNSIATKGINIIEGRKKDIHNVNIINVTNTGIYYAKGYEINVHDCHITGNENSTSAIGIDIHKSDSHFTDIIIIDCNIAIRTGAYLNYFTRIHAWILNYQNLPNSKFFDIADKCIAFLNQCYSDTYQDTIYQETYESEHGNPQVFINQLSVQYNPSIYSYAHHPVNPYVFKLQTNNDTSNIKVTNSYFKGNTAAQITTGFCNTSEFYGITLGNIFSTITRNSKSSIKSLLTGLTPITNEVIKNGNTVTINALFSYDAETIGSGEKTIGTIEYFYRPETPMNTVAYINTSEYSGPSDNYSVTYLYHGTGNNINVRFPSGTGTKYLHINETYVVNNN